MHWLLWIAVGFLVLLAAVAVYDVLQRKHAILRVFPVIGHLRYILETFGPELRQYIVTGNDEERPFSRDQRSWIYASAKKQNSYFGFGTDNELENVNNFLIIRHSAFPKHTPVRGQDDYDPLHPVPCLKVLGAARGRTRAFRPPSVVNVSAMSYGSLSSAAVQAINSGCAAAGCLHNTGEGGVSPHHLHGGDLVWQIGTGYFGCRTQDGAFDLDCLRQAVEKHDSIKALEIKLSQGAKPGLGGVLPKSKITAEIAEIRGIRRDRDCISPACHSAFSDVSSMLDFVERLASETGLPVGIKSAVGQLPFWEELAHLMDETDRGVDFITIDGGEGGTGAGPLAFTDHVALPFKQAFARVYSVFAERGLADDIVWNGSGKLGLPENAMLAFALGVDMVFVAREAMIAVGCIQAQRCHTGGCPTGIATQNAWKVRGLIPEDKGPRMKNYAVALRYELMRLAHACGVDHPGEVTLDMLEILDGHFGSRPAREVFGYQPHWADPPS
ncbi:MAG: FMN-binding glutamate synthase family protein [Thermoanaerobaculia bacterium]|nr:FMN-binding glutamate synthase family protein [Thermoanaerobaculia bacterium]